MAQILVIFIIFEWVESNMGFGTKEEIKDERDKKEIHSFKSFSFVPTSSSMNPFFAPRRLFNPLCILFLCIRLFIHFLVLRQLDF